MESITPLSPPDPPPESEVRYAPVGVGKFVVLNLVTFGCYSIVWFFRMWRSIKKDEGLEIWAWPRALFGVLFYHSLLQRLNVPSAALLALGYFALSVTWRLPNPYWVVSVFSFLFLIPAVRATNALNAGVALLPLSAGWRLRDGVLIGLGLVILPLAVIGTFGQSASVKTASEISEQNLAYLLELGVLQEDEAPLYFYSNGIWSIENDGVLISDWGVTSYWTDPVTEHLSFATAAYSQIVEVEVNFASNVLGSTIVRITTTNGDWFSFVLSPEEGRDREVVEEIERRRIPIDTQTITALVPRRGSVPG